MMITQERLKELLCYDPLTGVFLWRGGQRRTVAGQTAGTVDKDGYIRICADRKLYRAHRLAWLWVTGASPVGEIDHIDLDKANNRFLNLREATRSQNCHNTAKRGYTFDKRRNAFVAQIKVNGKHLHLGQFDNAADATAAYNVAAEKFHGEFARAA